MDWLSADAAGRLADGLVVTLVITLLTSVLALAAAAWVAGARQSPRRAVRVAAVTYTEVFRNVPALIQIIFWAFAFPTVVAPDTRRTLFFDNAWWDMLSDLTGLSIPYYACAAALGLVLNTSAHLAEILRSGLEAIPEEHAEAARSLGASRRRAYATVQLPLAARRSFPGLSNRLVHNMKNTALVSFVAVPDLFHAMQANITETFRASEYLLLVGVVYLCLSLIMTAGLDRLDRRLHHGRPAKERVRVHG